MANTRLVCFLAVAGVLFLCGCSAEPPSTTSDLIMPVENASDVLGDMPVPEDTTAALSLRVISSAPAVQAKAAQDGDHGMDADVADAGSNSVEVSSAFVIFKDIKLIRDGDPDDCGTNGDVGTNGDCGANGYGDCDTNGNAGTSGVANQAYRIACEEGENDGCHETIHLRGPFLVDLVNVTVDDLSDGVDDTSSNGADDVSSNGTDDVSTNGSDDVSTNGADDVSSNGTDVDTNGSDATSNGEPPDYLFDVLDLPPGTYRKIKIAVSRLQGWRYGLEDHPMNGLSVLITGTIDDIPFEYASAKTEQLQFKSRYGLVVEEGLIATMLLTLDMSQWFAGVDLSNAEVGDDGVVHVNQHSNKALFRQIRQQIREQMSFGHDDYHHRHRYHNGAGGEG